ncbi:hypothetical protein [Plasmodium yoelii yoelii]|uniref:Uncharacterized protein n=1 Tax=Plasmodium yoelii yoelii TaxID=73239 RepID=Q7REE2_PLAYO|nr:hypothetical protein [Plasmodium yoelii yoelii]
MILLNLQI